MTGLRGVDMFRLVTDVSGDENQGYRWDDINWDDELAVSVPGVSDDWRLILVDHYHGGRYRMWQLPVLVAVAGPYKGAHLAWMYVDPDDELSYIERIEPDLFGEGITPSGPFALALIGCVEGCTNPAVCRHPDERMLEAAEIVQGQLFEALKAPAA
jgi:hypothetical protein